MEGLEFYMENSFPTWRSAVFKKSSFLILVYFLFAANGLFGQQKEATIHVSDLKGLITVLEDTYQIRFAYKMADIEKVKSPFVWRRVERSEFEKQLSKLLAPLALATKGINSNYYSIFENQTLKVTPHKSLILFDLNGVVVESKEEDPVPFATIRIKELDLVTLSDDKGMFSFSRLRAGNYSLEIRSYGKVPLNQVVLVDSALSIPVEFRMKDQILGLEEVEVLATEKVDNGEPTSSEVSRQAIDHLQASSLADIMQLVPGKLAENPDLTSVNKMSLRQVATDNMGSLGTSLIVNGAPISNNANLQLNHTATGGVNASYATTAGAGIDYRQVPADNIESVEIIRGIPSVQYGDLTSGAVIVKTKTGEYPWQLKLKVNPTLTQISLGKGLNLGGKLGTLNVDFDYANAFSDPRFSVNNFNRYTGGIIHQKDWGGSQSLYTQTGINLGANISQRKLDPDDPDQTKNLSEDFSFRFHHNGKWRPDKKFAREFNYYLSGSYGIQNCYQQELTSGGFPITFVMKDTLAPASLVPGTYLSQLWVKGRPYNFFGKVENKFNFQVGTAIHNILAGIEWKTDGNNGEGKIYDKTAPPRLEAGVGTRPRSFTDIPAFSQFSLFVQDHFYMDVAGRELAVQAGLRYDNVQPSGLFASDFDQVISPRVNVSYDLLKNITLRGGYGLAAKSPTLAYLYPQNAFYDQVSLNHTPENANERLVLVRTFVVPTTNASLEMAVNRKKELGLNWSPGEFRINLTAYHEKMNNGYQYQNSLDTYQQLIVPKYQVVSRPENELPIVSDTSFTYDTLLTNYQMPFNNLAMVNKGLEFDVDFGTWEQVRTSLRMNGAYMQSISSSSDYYVLKKLPVTGKERDQVGIYPKGRGIERDRFNTTFRLIHHIPQFRMIATLVAQTIWIERNRYVGYATNAIGYVRRQDGEVIWLNESESEHLDPIADEDIVQQIADEYYLPEKWPPLWLFNFKLTKEIGKNGGFSFFANNIFMSRPLHESSRWSSQYTRRNPQPFFGMEFILKIE